MKRKREIRFLVQQRRIESKSTRIFYLFLNTITSAIIVKFRYISPRADLIGFSTILFIYEEYTRDIIVDDQMKRK